MLAHFLKSFVPDSSEWLTLSRFREAVFFEIEPDQIIEGMVAAMAAEPAGSARELFFYNAALALSYQAANRQEAFAQVYEFADNRSDLIALRTLGVSSNLPEGYLERMERGTARTAERTDSLDRVRYDFARDAATIVSGENLNGLVWAARVYLGIFPDVDHALPLAERLVPILGDLHATMAVDGLVAALSRPDVPTLQDVIDLAVQRQYRGVWHVYIAGLCEHFRRTSSVEGLPEEPLRVSWTPDLGPSAKV